jgi:cytochrome c553
VNFHINLLQLLMKLLLLLFFTITSYGLSPMEALYLKNACNSCHGMYGEGMGASPRLQGVREAVLLRRLKDLQQGKTRTAFGGVMISFAKALDTNQTIEMAKYLSTLTTQVNDDRYDIEYEPSGDGGS